MKEKEIWKDVVGYEGRYQISSQGRVLSTGKYIDGRIFEPKYVKTRLDIGGYVTVALYKGRLGKEYKVHRLVAQAFIPNPQNLPFVDHINTKRNDNRVSNLRWCTHQENCNNPLTRKNISRSAKIAFNKEEIRKQRTERMLRINDIVVAKRRKKVKQFSLDGQFIKEYKSMNDAARAISGYSGYIRDVCNGKARSYKGFIWKYV